MISLPCITWLAQWCAADDESSAIYRSILLLDIFFQNSNHRRFPIHTIEMKAKFADA